MVVSRAIGLKYQQRECGHMRQVISYLIIVFVVAPLLCVGIQAETSPEGASGTKIVLSLNNSTNDSIALNAAILKKLPLSSAPLQANRVRDRRVCNIKDHEKLDKPIQRGDRASTCR